MSRIGGFVPIRKSSETGHRAVSTIFSRLNKVWLMNETNTPANLGVPIAVDVDAIEQELTGLWKSASQSGNENAVMRACSCNVVVVAQDQREAESLPDIL